ncbi:FCD domain-containing protein [Xinfangfangia sp. CPCC 101601]|uniref:FCD domain-containing protein n=1 Tax=Pseudogemmobacter lacusdianii TaxID=3069608 RepID=A0ABU0VVW0_9RHOB|nr:FCD domain-containing protein [Xinfangfangia sp. CPCC 101601]MDQ2065881.1 FCD domain-containing protein [Xinfangfangia sp. CPCC 101601]
MDDKLPLPLDEQIRLWIAENKFNHNDRLPPERALSQRFGVSRGELRKALAALEGDGLIWRHVGRGTFIGARPVLNLADVAFLGELASPAQVIAARLVIEPELARLAALYGTRSDFDEILSCAQRCREASTWRSYEAWDNNLHYAVAKATHNKLLVYLFDILNVVRRSTVWGQPRISKLPPRDHRSFAEHDAFCAAIQARDAQAASQKMRDHLISVRERVLPALGR